MVGLRRGWTTLALALSMVCAVPAARAVDLHLFADPARICAYLATAGVDDVARVEILLTVLQRDMAGGEARERLMSMRGDSARLDGEARTVERAISAIEVEVIQGHALLRALHTRLHAVDDVVSVAELSVLKAQIRAASEELIELSFDLRDAKGRLSALRSAMAGRRDSISMIDAARSTARQFSRAIRDCVLERRARLSGIEIPTATCETPAP